MSQDAIPQQTEPGIIEPRNIRTRLALGLTWFFLGAALHLYLYAEMGYVRVFQRPLTSYATLYWIGSIPAMLLVLLAPPLATLTKKPILVSTLALGAVIAFAATSVQDFAVMSTLTAGWGYAISLSGICGTTMAVESCPKSHLGRTWGAFSSIHALGALVASLLLVVFVYQRVQSPTRFVVSGIFITAALISAAFIRQPIAAESTPVFVFRKRYGLYYALTFFTSCSFACYRWTGWSEFRRQYQMPWLSQEVIYITGLLILILTLPLAGYLIDRFGERKAFQWFSLCLTISSLAFVVSPNVQALTIARLLEFAANAFSLALTIYVARRSMPGEFFQTYAVGVTIYTACEGICKLGLEFLRQSFHNTQLPFLLSALFAVGCLILSQRIKPEQSALSTP